MKNILIFGSGSIGNHFANACRKMKFAVNVTDVSSDALLRMKNKIYPSRYLKWDNKIKLINYSNVFQLKKKFDLIIIGTPPATHLRLIEKISKYLNFEKLLVEKPFTTYKLNFNQKKIKLLTNKKKIFVGYNHSISESFSYFKKLTKKINKKNIKLIEVNWREGWKGILKAHFWNSDEFSSYLGDLSKGGGSIHEHSHGIHLLVCLSKILNFKIPNKMTKFKSIRYNHKNKNIYYDNYFNVNWECDGFVINYITDLISEPANKSISIYTSKTKYELIFNYNKKYDLVKKTIIKSDLVKSKYFKKKRSTDFINEIIHINKINNNKKYLNSFINITKGMETQYLINSIAKK